MVLDKVRHRIDPILDAVARHVRFSPNAMSFTAFALAFVALFFYARAMLLPAAAAVLLNGVFDGLDGSVARAQGKASKRGDMLDHVLDRYADSVIILGVAFNCNFYLAFFPVVTVLIVSYLGVEAHALSGKRDYGGLLGRADRVVLLTIFSAIQPLFVIGPLTPLDMLMIYFILAGTITVIQRSHRLWRDLRE